TLLSVTSLSTQSHLQPFLSSLSGSSGSCLSPYQPGPTHSFIMYSFLKSKACRGSVPYGLDAAGAVTTSAVTTSTGNHIADSVLSLSDSEVYDDDAVSIDDSVSIDSVSIDSDWDDAGVPFDACDEVEDYDLFDDLIEEEFPKVNKRHEDASASTQKNAGMAPEEPPVTHTVVAVTKDDNDEYDSFDDLIEEEFPKLKRQDKTALAANAQSVVLPATHAIVVAEEESVDEYDTFDDLIEEEFPKLNKRHHVEVASASALKNAAAAAVFEQEEEADDEDDYDSFDDLIEEEFPKLKQLR
ncbi:hypothetical protein GGR56DRAFT_688120, partial [Xylariaceae sp. FL0804]